jgi:hypothetical protein
VACHIASTATAAAWWAAASGFALYAAWRRAALRRRFGLPGSPVGDAAAWLCCPACALCQESRTLAHNNVTGGFWLGPLQQQRPVGGAAAAAEAAATGYPVHHAPYGSPPPRSFAPPPPQFVVTVAAAAPLPAYGQVRQ